MLRRIGLALAIGVALSTQSASAQLDVRALVRATASHGGVLPKAFKSGAMPLLVEFPDGAPAPPGLVPIAPGFATFEGSFDTVSALASAHPDWQITWAPPRHPLIDMATETTHASQFRNLEGLDGKGVVIGIVDTGFDPKHPDLRDENGKTRVAWALDLSQSAAGKHPELEASYGCNGDNSYSCAVYDSADLDEMIAKDSPLLPHDTLGHGTHVASLAASNGLSSNPPKYRGVAPGATIIGARVTRGASSSILDPDVLLATRFVFERAKELGMPAIVNLSLGSDFGGHDGKAPLERALASFVGSAFPGRAIVVAAGNSGGVYSNLSSSYPSPFGIYTEVHVPRASSVRVPLLTPPVGKATTNATIYVWIAGRPGDQLEVGVDDGDGNWVEPLPPGESAAYDKDGLEASILNQTYGEGSPLSQGSNGAVVVLDGTFPSAETFAIRLEGHGTARLWVQSEGDLSPGGSTPGALFSRAAKEGTIGIPASTAGVIAVGATINRLGWTDRAKQKIKVGSFAGIEDPKTDSSAYFSGAGPNSNGQMKPDLVAPGVFVVGAMSSLADPDKNGDVGIFSSGSVCDTGTSCLVVDDFHAITSGTSMAAPIVSGAIALLFAKDPALTQDQVRTLLQAGAKKLDGDVQVEQQVGPGELDLIGTLQVMNAEKSPINVTPTAEQSWLALAASYAHPDPDWPLVGVVELRGADEGIADGFDPARLGLSAEGAAVVEPLTRIAPGMWRFSLAAPPGSGGRTLSLKIQFDGQDLLTRTLPVAVDRWVAISGADARGGCSVSGASSPVTSGLCLLSLISIAGLRRRNQRKTCVLG